MLIVDKLFSKISFDGTSQGCLCGDWYIFLFNYSAPSGLWFYTGFSRGLHPRLLIFSHFVAAVLVCLITLVEPKVIDSCSEGARSK